MPIRLESMIGADLLSAAVLTFCTMMFVANAQASR